MALAFPAGRTATDWTEFTNKIPKRIGGVERDTTTFMGPQRTTFLATLKGVLSTHGQLEPYLPVQ